MSAVVLLTGVSKSFGALHVLRDLDLAVPAGEVMVVMGASGSGKTTMLRTINFLEMPERGSIEVAGIRIDAPPDGRLRRRDRARLREIRSRTAMVFQSFNLFPHRTALQNVMEGLVSVRGMTADEARIRARALLARMDLTEKESVYPAHLSGGQKQRVAIARGLAMQPEIMLFDEPTSALDPALRYEVLTVMRELAAEGMTMIVVTHEVSFARDVADRLIFFEGGRIVADGPPRAIIEGAEHPSVQRYFARLT